LMVASLVPSPRSGRLIRTIFPKNLIIICTWIRFCLGLPFGGGRCLSARLCFQRPPLWLTGGMKGSPRGLSYRASYCYISNY
jgi:hypothetical protein